MKQATPRQQRILDYICTFVRMQGYPPTYEEIRDSMGLSTKSLVSHHLRSLEAKGYLRLRRNTPRGIQLANRPVQSTFRVSIEGQIAAGQPISFGDWQREFIELTTDIVREQEGLYALRVKGNSMVDALVHDGDVVIMKHQQYADDGDMVAVRLVDENETTLKRLYRENGRVRLQPANPTMKAMYCRPANVQVQGKVVAVIRQVA